MRTVGTTSRGVRCPVIREGDDLVKIVTDAILACGKEQNIEFQDKDIVAVLPMATFNTAVLGVNRLISG